MSSLKNELQQIEFSVRYGHIAPARTSLRKLARKSLPRESLATVARLMERAGLADQGVRLLLRIVRPSRRGPVAATPVEKAEYAVCLIRLGAAREALSLLGEIDPAKVPRAYFYEALAVAASWDYAGSIPPLKRYLALPKLPPYQRLIGEVNLAAALVFERQVPQATALLRRLLHETSVQKLPLLMANTLELAAEHFIQLGQFKEAEKCLKKAKGLLSDSGTIYEFLVHKWSLILDYMRGNTSNLNELRRVARERRHWETLRDCDRFTVLRTQDRELALHLHFGTPFESFRRHLAAELRGRFRPGETYDWKLGGTGRTGWTLDLVFGRVLRGSRVVTTLKTGQLSHRMLSVLASDFYRPFRIADLHGRLHPGDFFHPETSPKRLHQAMGEIRKWLSASGIPLYIFNDQDLYSLRAREPMILRVAAGEKLGRAKLTEIELLRSRFQDCPFSTQDVVDCLDLSRRTAQRLLREWVENETVEKSGGGGFTKYRLSDPSR